ncbi:selenide, water dikinase SelD [Celeribacter litoreus]|uniref:selenide, water dikinase SelD n=1 Tax=Celeribacter litoreus TaxID=2876714 RepID=UPI001CCCEF97|nr:selenide, water dikinase SelD [Celeribacter litoreus]MCA0044533.1 selenide, water dikinase SelD [Celeribacter litoreus]
MHELPLTRELVLIGGGHSHALLLKRWGMSPLPGVRVTVINPGAVAAYSGMLPGFVAGHYERGELELDVIRLARFAGARAILGRAVGIDRVRRLIQIEGHPPVYYDFASIDIGITSAMPELEGFSEHGIAAKPLEAFAQSWDSYQDAVRARTMPRKMAVIGGGVAGAELAMAMAHRLRDIPEKEITLIDRGEIAKEMSPKTRHRMLQALADLNVTLRPQTEVTQIAEDGLHLSDGSEIASVFTLGAAGARPYKWLEETGLDLHEGFVTVSEHLQSSDPRIFAAGDCAYLSHAPRPKAGVYAVREAPVLYENLRAVLSKGLKSAHLRTYTPQKDYLKLISLGGQDALADKAGVRFSGPLMWRWKDHIDRKFMSKLKDLTPMKPPALPEHVADGLREEVEGKKPMCGACGAKVGGEILSRVLQDHPGPERPDVLHLDGDDAAILTHGDTWQVASVDHLRAFVEDPVLMTRITALHALGDIWAMGGAPQSALATVTLPKMTEPLQEAWLTEIMETARDTFEDAGAEIIGGHTAMGAEFSIGFTVTGLIGQPITLKGARAGDQLILTKPIGTGVMLAAEMEMKADGRDMVTTYASMSQSSGEASRILENAHAMTDVTGFGLAGHLLGMCRRSDVGAEIHLSKVPVLSGALELSKQGVRSTIFPANRAYAAEYEGPDSALSDLLFDPQTAGGLLAAVSPMRAEKCLTALREAGYEAAIIGEITEGPVSLRVLS